MPRAHAPVEHSHPQEDTHVPEVNALLGEDTVRDLQDRREDGAHKERVGENSELALCEHALGSDDGILHAHGLVALERLSSPLV